MAYFLRQHQILIEIFAFHFFAELRQSLEPRNLTNRKGLKSLSRHSIVDLSNSTEIKSKTNTEIISESFMNTKIANNATTVDTTFNFSGNFLGNRTLAQLRRFFCFKNIFYKQKPLSLILRYFWNRRQILNNQFKLTSKLQD